MKLKTIVLIVFIVLIAIISLQNASSIEVNFLFWSFSTPQILVIIGSFSFGIIVGMIISLLKSKDKGDLT